MPEAGRRCNGAEGDPWVEQPRERVGVSTLPLGSYPTPSLGVAASGPLLVAWCLAGADLRSPRDRAGACPKTRGNIPLDPW